VVIFYTLNNNAKRLSFNLLDSLLQEIANCKKVNMAAAQTVDPKPPDGDGAEGQGRDTATTNINPTSYANRLKTNVRYDHRLKRNVLEITVEKSDKDARIDLEPGMVARILNSISIDIGNQVEGY
jgi:hypothetical protein